MSIAQILGEGGETPNPGQQIRQMGLRLAVVTNVSDEKNFNRVKCMPVENENKEETDWCYVMAPLGGKKCGQFFFPNVGDLVVLGYLGGERPIVLGAVWNTKVPPPYTIPKDGKVYNFSIKTPGGSELLFYDEPKKEKLSLTTPAGSKLVIDDEKKSAVFSDKSGENKLTMDFEKGKITLCAKTELTLCAGKTEVTLQSAGQITEKAQNKVSLNAATIEGKASAKLSLQGAAAEIKADSTMNVQASGPLQVKGAMVKIN